MSIVRSTTGFLSLKIRYLYNEWQICFYSMVSVCMATYNGQKYLREQVNSILSQLSEEDELIVSDDGSTDETLAILASYGESRIKVYSHVKENTAVGKSNMQLVAENLQFGLRQCQGDYIFLSDQDDIWLPGKVEKCVAGLQEYDLVNHDCKVVDENLNVIYSSYFNLVHTKEGFIHNFVKFGYLGCCMAFRKEVLSYVLPFDSKIAHDAWFCYLAELLGNCKCISDPLLLYRRHGKNTSGASQKSTNPIWYRIAYRIPYLWRIMKRYFAIKCN